MKEKLFNEGVRLALEIGLNLKVELEGVDLPLESSFVGFINEFIIITPPAPYGQIRHKLFDGAEMLIRYFYNGTIFAFQTKLFAHVEKPINLLFIEYPKLIQKSELRSEKRATCYVETTFVSGEKENKGAILDITRTGCQCRIRRRDNKFLIPFKVNDLVLLKAKFPGVKTPMEIHGVVKNIRSSNIETNFGMMFHENTTEVTQKVITWYISTIENFASSHEVQIKLP
ncbi:MAG: flagellar brake protein [Desulfobulbaceae bacterium]|uniref:Flagellar brake protein n=1 Tax=Candidatus Desulfobia pelagia TaxID=2841692 RepID=A0A8J6TEV4_9BACT|nr:flagellar brake protein [Candidatus Desulfobia pelagia]